jgi:hypothetical protein
MPQQNVKTHTRRTASGKTATVRQHSRQGRGRKGALSPARAWRNARRAFSAARRHKRLTAAGFGALAVGELAAWSALRGLSLVAVTAGLLALGVAAVAGMASGMDV